MGTLLASLEDASKIDFYYSFPYLDTFTVKLTVRDSALNEDFEIKTYDIDECPVCPPSGGAPSGPAIAEKYSDPIGEVTVTNVTAVDCDTCDIDIKAKKVDAIDFDDSYFHVKAKIKKK